MFSAVNYALKLLEGIDMSKLKQLDFYEEVSYMFDCVTIKEGDYEIWSINENGELIMRFVDAYSRKESMFPEALVGSVLNKPQEGLRESCTNKMLESIERVICKDKCSIKIDDSKMDQLEHLQRKIKECRIKNDEELESTFYEIRELQHSLPVFEIHDNDTGEILGKLDGCLYCLSTTSPRSIYIMKKIGKGVFECRDGKLEVDMTPEGLSIEEIEKMKDDLVSSSKNIITKND